MSSVRGPVDSVWRLPEADGAVRPVTLCMLAPATVDEASAVAKMRDAAARWLLANGIQQWRPGELGPDFEDHDLVGPEDAGFREMARRSRQNGHP